MPMKKEEDKKALRRNTVILVGVILMILLLAFSSVFYKQSNRFAYAEHLEDPVLTLEDESVSLREFGYYIFEVERFTQQQAKQYNPGDLLDYWNTHFSAGNDSTFVSELARDTAINKCVGDLVYVRMAKEDGRKLSEEAKKEAAEEAKAWMQELSPEQTEILGLDESLVTGIKEREKLAADYAYEYSKKADLTGYSGKVTELLSGGGDYFQDKLLSRYQYTQNDKLIAKLRFGRITVNSANLK